MRAVWITRSGGPEVLEVREGPDPEPKAGEVRIRVKAAGLNFAEVMARQGMYPAAPKPPCVVGYEAAGVIDALGEGVKDVKVGARVLVLTRFGGHADTICVPAVQALLMPEGMSFEEGAALPVNYLTAFHMLFRVAGLRPRQRVLVHAAAGGVGIAVLQLCRTIEGVETYGTASASKHSIIRDNGCTHPIDYHQVDYGDEVRRLTDGKGVDIVLDPLGGKDWKKGYDLLRPAGKLIAFGFSNMASGEKRSVINMARQAVRIPIFTPMSLMNTNRSIAGVDMGGMWDEVEMLHEELYEVFALYREGKVKPHIGEVFPFDRAADAHRCITERKNIGKVVLVP